MKILHAAQSISPDIGIQNQMLWEHHAARRLNLQWQSAIYAPAQYALSCEIVVPAPSRTERKGIVTRLHAWVKQRMGYYCWLRSQEPFFDIIMLRHSVADFFEVFFLLGKRKPVYLVHHTLELPELMANGLAGRLKAFFESMTGFIALRYADGIIGVTDEIIKYEQARVAGTSKQSFKYPNGVIYFDEEIQDCRGEVPELLFIASSFVAWHGLDRLVDSIRQSDAHFKLHLVGDVGLSYKELIKNDSRVLVHGKLGQNEIKRLAETCWLGISSLALDRKGMKEACTLKVREYLMLGLPVYAGYKEVFPESFEYYKRGSADIANILDFAKSNRTTSNQEIRMAAQPFIDKIILLHGLHHDLEKSWLQQSKIVK